MNAISERYFYLYNENKDLLLVTPSKVSVQEKIKEFTGIDCVVSQQDRIQYIQGFEITRSHIHKSLSYEKLFQGR